MFNFKIHKKGKYEKKLGPANMSWSGWYSPGLFWNSAYTGPWNQPKNDHISAYIQPTHLIFGTVIYIFSIFCHAKNQVGGSCVGGVSKKAREISPTIWHITGEYYSDRQKTGRKKYLKKACKKDSNIKKGCKKVWVVIPSGLVFPFSGDFLKFGVLGVNGPFWISGCKIISLIKGYSTT